MEIIEVTHNDFDNILNYPYHIFGSAEFSELNKYKVEDVHYLLFKNGKYRLGIAGGIRSNTFYSPFSAPFGGFIFLNEDIKINYIDEALDLLIEWLKENKVFNINITLPPIIYNKSLISKQINSLFRAGFDIKNIDLNYSFKIEKFTNEYSQFIRNNARKNLKIALNQNLSFKKCDTIDEIKSAYEVIKINRSEKGYPLRMSFDNILTTIKLINADFFIVKNINGLSIASAIVFHTSKDIAQIIYWGDLFEFSNLKTMNFLSFKVFEYYNNINLKVIDIGPSTENSVPNFGLCEFKESIGCDITTKVSFVKNLV